MKKLTNQEIEKRLKELSDWDYYDDGEHTECQSYKFKDFMSAKSPISFECEALNHHPEWSNVYNILEIKLTTHDADGVTELDFELAKAIDKIVEVEE